MAPSGSRHSTGERMSPTSYSTIAKYVEPPETQSERVPIFPPTELSSPAKSNYKRPAPRYPCSPSERPKHSLNIGVAVRRPRRTSHKLEVCTPQVTTVDTSMHL
jgi:hypothetical protein